MWRRCFPPPLEGLFWFRAIEAGTQPGQFDFAYGVLSRGGEPFGIVPAFVFDVPLDLVMPPAIAKLILPFARGPLEAFAVQRTFFIGNVAGEEGHVGLLPGHKLGEVSSFIHAGARAKATAMAAPMLVWKDFPHGDRIELDALCAGGRVFRIPSFPGTSIPLHAGGYTSFQEGLNSKRRHRINAKLRRGEAAIPLRAQTLVSPDDAELDTMFALFEQTAARATTRFERLTRDFFAAAARFPESTFIVLRDTAGAIRAFMLMFDLGDRMINQFIGLDYSTGDNAYLHFRLFVAAYDAASRGRARALCSGQTGYTAKLDLGHALVPLWNYCEHAHGWVNAIFRRGASGISWRTLDPQLAEYLRSHPEADGLKPT